MLQEKAGARILVVSRDPVVHTRAGSSTYLLSLLSSLAEAGHQIRLCVTDGLGPGRKPVLRILHADVPREWLWFPGYLRVGHHLVRWNSPASYRHASGVGWRMLSDRLLGLRGRAAPRHQPAPWDIGPATDAELVAVQAALRTHRPDVVIANYAFMAPILDLPEAAGSLRIVVMHDLLSARAALLRAGGLPPDSREYGIDEEMALLRRADLVAAIQSEEAATVRAHLPGTGVVCAPMPAVRSRAAERPQVAGRCMFVGTKNTMNLDGLRVLLDHVWPQVRQHVPSATLHVCGRICECIDISYEGVRLCGVVPDLQAEYDAAEVCVVPIFTGTGMKIKLVEAVGHGRAVVTTSSAVRGLDPAITRCMDIEDTPAGMAGAIAGVLAHPDRRRRMEEAARHAAERHLSPRACFRPLFDAIAQGSGRSSRRQDPTPEGAGYAATAR